jgi:hypothetical protein
MSETTGNAGRVQMSPVNSAPATKLGAVTRSKNVLPGALRPFPYVPLHAISSHRLTDAL